MQIERGAANEIDGKDFKWREFENGNQKGQTKQRSTWNRQNDCVRSGTMVWTVSWRNNYTDNEQEVSTYASEKSLYP